MPFVFEKNYGEYIIAALFDSAGEPVVAIADGRVAFPDSDTVFDAHPNAGILSALLHPSGVGLITGGDDGRIVWTTKDAGPVEIAAHKGAWFDALAASAESGLLAAASGKQVHVHDLRGKDAPKILEHPSSVSGLAFDAKGRKLYAASYNGAYVWFARLAQQKPQLLKWAGSHTAIALSPDDKFLITAMQDNSLHGWRLSDAKDMRMGGYPAKIKSLSFFAHGKLLATSGANGAVVWPFLKATGPMGENASEIAAEDSAFVTIVAGAAEDTVLAGGLDDGRVWLAELKSTAQEWIKREKGSPISALDLSPEANRVLIGDEDGSVYIYEA